MKKDRFAVELELLQLSGDALSLSMTSFKWPIYSLGWVFGAETRERKQKNRARIEKGVAQGGQYMRIEKTREW